MNDSRELLKNLVVRGDNLTLPANVDGLYNNLFFDMCADDALLAFTLFGGYSGVLDAIGFETENVNNKVVNFITYVGPEGTAAGSPTSGVQTNACEPGQSVEAGFCQYNLSGWGRLRRSSPIRDITDVTTKYCDQSPTYTIAGQRIQDDYVWDLTRINAVILQDLQRQIIVGNQATAGEHNGLSRIINYNYATIAGQECTSMDSTVIDYNGQAMCPTEGAEGVEINGVAAADGYQLLDYINAWLRRTAKRIRMSSLNGAYRHIGLISTEALSCLLDCYVCFVTCGRDVSRMNEPEVRTEIARLKNQLNQDSAITLNHQGINVTWYTYDYEMINGSGNTDIYILTPQVGNTPLLRVQVKDMSNAANHPAMNAAEMRVSDGNRILSWTTIDHTCYQVHSEIQWRLWNVAPWAQLRITDVACDPIFGNISGDPLSDFYPEQNLVAAPETPTNTNFIQQVAPVAGFSSVEDGLELTFTNTTTGNVTGYLWTFGDGTYSTEANPVHTYAGAGTYNVTLIAYNGPNLSDAFSANVTPA